LKITRRIEIDNIVRVSSKKDINKYREAILIRMQPGIYNKYGCIKIRFTRDLTIDVDKLCRFFWHAGLVVKDVDKDVERLKDGLKVDKGVVIGEAWEVTLKKIPAIEFENDEDYKDWTYQIFEFKNK